MVFGRVADGAPISSPFDLLFGSEDPALEVLRPTHAEASSPAPAGRPNPRLAFEGRTRAFADITALLLRTQAESELAPPTLAGDLELLRANPRFADLDPRVQRLAIQEISRHPEDAGARRTLSRLITSAGFGRLNDRQQQRLLRLTGGTNSMISDPSRERLARLLRSPAFTRASGAEQERRLERFLERQPGTPGVLGAPEGTYDDDRRNFEVGRPVRVASYDFESGAAPARRFMVRIGDRRVPVFMPIRGQSRAGELHTINEVARGLAALPPASLRTIREVRVDPRRNPADEYWAREYDTPSFRSYMTAGADGVVSIYPTRREVSQTGLDGSLIHETGHILSDRRWGQDSGNRRWAAWRRADRLDGLSVSQYAESAPEEDFAETLKLYHTVRGTPEEAQFRAMFRHRFRLLDRLLGLA